MSTPVTPLPGFLVVPTTATLDFTPGTRIGVGEGMNSEVFFALDHQLDAQVVMKKVEKARLGNSSQFFAEARRLYDARHRHVVDVKYACQDADHVYFAMPFYGGGSLESVINRRFLTIRETVRYGLEFLSGLHHVHVKGLVHLDIKPTNVLLDDSDTAGLADFGLSREVTTLGFADMPRAYKRHMPPERTGSLLVTQSADIYQAGSTLYRMVNGNEDFEAQAGRFPDDRAMQAAIAAGTFPDRKRFLPHVPRRLVAAITKALAVDPANRFQTVLELLNAIAQVDESLDWVYTPGATWGAGQWRESKGGRTRTVDLLNGGPALWSVVCSRTAASGRVQSFGAFSAQRLAEKDARRLLKKALTEPWR